MVTADTTPAPPAPPALPDGWHPFRKHETQQALWQCQDRMVAVRAGRGSGKTAIAMRRLVRSLAEKTWHGQPRLNAFVGPTYNQARRVAWNILKGLIDKKWLVKEPSETEMSFTTIWGSQLIVIGLDKPARFEGRQYDFVVVDEGSDIKPGAIDRSIRPALTVRKGVLWRIGVPKRSGVGAREFRRVCEDRSRGYTFFHWSAEDLLDEHELKILKGQLDAKDYKEQIQGHAVEAGGQAFYCFSKENVSAGEETTYDKDRTIVVGSDFNVNPMAWILAHTHNNKLFVFDEIWLRDTNTRATLDFLHRQYPQHQAGWVFMGDASSKARKTVATSTSASDYLIIKQDERFRSGKGVNISYPAKNPAIKDRLASCNALLCNAKGERRLFVSPTCRQLIEDLESRDLDEYGQPTDATPDSGHMTDALGYAVHGLFPIYYTTQGDISLSLAGAEV